ncbi:rhodanese-like domain-containing protein [Niallia endozanthoxylica]|uniref:Rhodanese domain-containing protein n=1 Tax=Niallia endozanthoxylica TaxID=2036016 RepID=A0A5J5HQ80_9BACI|nr:hypothetical protein [Niallia endozanthoxylica]KAA9022621.1 hypothetical protein F4V44_15225 [Niallia endozanthoxylica]
MTFLILSTAIVIFILYRRYFPVLGVQCNHFSDLDLDKINVIDVRDFNESCKNPIEGAINIPIAYLKRNYHEIPNRDLHLVALSLVEKNMGIRLLRQKGFRVTGYTIMEQEKFSLKENSLEMETNR